MNYSRESINIILQPSWKLLNAHLPVFSEVLGYGHDINLYRQASKARKDSDDEEESGSEEESEEIYQVQMESEDEAEEYGVDGMTLQLIELLTTLVQRPNV